MADPGGGQSFIVTIISRKLHESEKIDARPYRPSLSLSYPFPIGLEFITYQSLASFLFLSIFFNSFDELRLCDNKYSLDILVVIIRSPTVKESNVLMSTRRNFHLIF